MKYRSIYFKNKLRLLDQNKLPTEVKYIECNSHHQIYNAIKTKQIRGGSIVGIAAAYGLAFAVDNLIKPNGFDCTNWEESLTQLREISNTFKETKLQTTHYYLDRMMSVAKDETGHRSFNLEHLHSRLLHSANYLYEQDKHTYEMVGKVGASRIENGMHMFIHGVSLSACESGSLSPLYTAQKSGKKFTVYVGEGRPSFEGAKLISWELKESGLNPILVCDSMAAHIMKEKSIDLVIVGADMVTKDGDVVSKIGTYQLALLAKAHHVPFYAVAPLNAFTFTASYQPTIGQPEEVTEYEGKKIAPKDIQVYNPESDITPHELITGIITDQGMIFPVNEQTVEKIFVL